MVKSKTKRLPKFSSTTIIKFPNENALNSYLSNDNVITLQGKIEAIAKKEYNGEVNSLIQRELKELSDKELHAKFTEETGKRALYKGKETLGFQEWFIIYKNKIYI